MAGEPLADYCFDEFAQREIARLEELGLEQAAVALARRVLGWGWAMLRDGTDWREPAAAVRVPAAAPGPAPA